MMEGHTIESMTSNDDVTHDAEDDDGASSGYVSPTSSARSRMSRSDHTQEDDEDEEEEEERFTFWPYGFQQKAEYEHGKKHPEIMGVTYNGRMRQFVILDSKGITTWSKDAIAHTVQRAMSYPKYEYRLISHLEYVRKYNVYFVLSKDFSVKVLNRDFDETCRVSADLRSVLFMLFNPIRDELITGGVGGTKVWRYHQMANKTWKEIKPMANYILTLKYELKNVGGSWVKKVELDLHQQHLYCCSDTDLHVYDLDGNSLFAYERAHAMSITGCAYSRQARHIVTASADTEVKVWSVMGGLVHTFRGHSQPITNLVVHPEDSALVLTSSLDGTVRLWSLEIMELLYCLQVSEEGVRWMGFTDDNHLYLSTVRHLTAWSLNTTTSFWSLARCQTTSLDLARGHGGKSTRVVAVGEDSSIRILSRVNKCTVSMVMPPPPISPLSHVRDVVHVRDVNVTYVLLNSRQLWLYTNKSDPACRIAVWDLLEVQAKLLEDTQARGQQMTREQEQEQRPSTAVFGAKGPSNTHRATVDGVGNEAVVECRCLCYLNSAAAVWTEEGLCCPIRHTYLLMGLEDGRILFMDPLIKSKKYMELRANKDAISSMYHDEAHQTLVTRCDIGDACLLQLWSLPELHLQYELYCPPDVSVYTRMDTVLLTGHSDGAIIRHQLVPLAEGAAGTKPKALRQGLAALFANHEKSGHRKSVTSLDVCLSLRVFLSASPDGSVKVWDEAKVQVAEIQLNNTLTSACFLNDYGDVLIAFHHHIFFIDRSKISRQAPPLAEDDDDGEESDQFEDESMLNDLGVAVDPLDMKSYLVPYRSELSKEFKEGGKYAGVDTPTDLQQDVEEAEVEREPDEHAPSEIYDSPRSTPRDLALLDLTLSREVTEYDIIGERAFLSKDSTAGKMPKKKMTPKERRRALKKKKVVFYGEPKLHPEMGVEMPQYEGSPSSTPRPSSASSSGSDDESGCSWLSYSTGGRSTPSNISWYSDEEEAGSGVDNQDGATPRSPRRAKPKPKPKAKPQTEEKPSTEGKDKAEADKVVSRKKSIFEDIRVDPQELLKEEAAKLRREKRRERRQADQSAALRHLTEEEPGKSAPVPAAPGAAPAPTTPPPPPAPPRKIREIKKKEKKAARRVGQSKDQPKPPDPEEQAKPETEEQEKTEGPRIEEEKRRAEEEEKKRRLIEEERTRKEEEEAEKQRQEEERKRKEEEEERRRGLELAAKRKAEEEENRKQELLQAAKERLLEKDKERQAQLSSKSQPVREEPSGSSSQKQSPKKRVVSANKVKSTKSGGKKRHKTSSPTRQKVAPPAKESYVTNDKPEQAIIGENDPSVKGKSLTPETTEEGATKEGSVVVEQGLNETSESPNGEQGSPKDPLLPLSPHKNVPPPLTFTDELLYKRHSISSSVELGFSPSMGAPSTPGLPPSTPGLPHTPGSPAVTSLSEFPSLITPPLSPTISSRPQTALSLLSKQQTLYSELGKKTKTVTFSPPASPTCSAARHPIGMSLLPTAHHDVQSWLASAPEPTHTADSVADTRSLLGDPRMDPQEEARSRSPGGWSDGGMSEMTVPHVDIPLAGKDESEVQEQQVEQENEDDWWWRKSRRRRSVASAHAPPCTPAEGMRKRPHTAHVLMEKLSTKELETYYQEALVKYQEMVGVPDVEKLYQNEGTKFEDNWQDRAIERHLLLKMQRQLRAQSANDKAKRLFQEQQQRMKQKIERKTTDGRFVPSELGFHLFHVQKANRSPVLVPSGADHPAITLTRTTSATYNHKQASARAHSVAGGFRDRKSRMSSAAPSVKTRPATAAGRMQATPAPNDTLSEKAELGAERPYRCRLSAPSANSKPRPQSVIREEIDIRLLDPRNPKSVMFRPRTGASVPSKCSRYVLIEGARMGPGEAKVMPTVMEQKLIAERFPEHKEEWTGHMKPPPKFRPPLILYHPPSFTQHSVT